MSSCTRCAGPPPIDAYIVKVAPAKPSVTGAEVAWASPSSALAASPPVELEPASAGEEEDDDGLWQDTAASATSHALNLFMLQPFGWRRGARR